MLDLEESRPQHQLTKDGEVRVDGGLSEGLYEIGYLQMRVRPRKKGYKWWR